MSGSPYVWTGSTTLGELNVIPPERAGGLPGAPAAGPCSRGEPRTIRTKPAAARAAKRGCLIWRPPEVRSVRGPVLTPLRRNPSLPWWVKVTGGSERSGRREGTARPRADRASERAAPGHAGRPDAVRVPVDRPVLERVPQDGADPARRVLRGLPVCRDRHAAAHRALHPPPAPVPVQRQGASPPPRAPP